jgi:ATP-binding cassette subfamily B protein
MKIPLHRYWKLLHTYLRPLWRQMLVLALLLALKIASRLINPQIVRGFLDQAMAGAPTASLLRYGAFFLAIAALTQILTIVNVTVGERVAWTATNALRLDLLRHCLGLDMVFHKAHRPGELTERIDTDVDALSNFFSSFVISIIGNGILAVGILILFFRQGWRYGVPFTLYAVIGMLVLVRLADLATPFWTRLHEIQAQFYGFLEEQFSGTEDIRANGAQGYVMRSLYKYFQQWLPINRNASLAGYAGWMTNAALVAAGEMLAYALSGYYFFRGELTIGEAYMIGSYMGLLFGQIADIRWQVNDLQHAEAGIGRIQQLFDLRSRLVDGTGGPLPAGALSVAFHDVSFAYDDRVEAPLAAADGAAPNGNDRVLHALTFDVAPGRVLGLLGRTGSGKTTLARLLLRLYDPTEGQIRLGDRALTDTTVQDLRDRVTLVTQEVQLFQASVRDNLALFNPAVSDAAIERTLLQLGLGEWLRALPGGLDTELASDGGGLSAGQAQLLAFARAFLANPDVVILDEASSRLDPATEQLIERAVDLLLADRTGIIIAHRLPTVQRADKILILEDGRSIEFGDRARLAADPGSHFHHLLQTGMQDVLA